VGVLMSADALKLFDVSACLRNEIDECEVALNAKRRRLLTVEHNLHNDHRVGVGRMVF
jgi:hypothetical protein